MILSGDAIRRHQRRGNITISPWDDEKINPNSYNLTLFPQLYEVRPNCGDVYDIGEPARIYPVDIPMIGLDLKPGVLYLGQTNEVAGSRKFVPMIEGRSSIGRCGIFIHVTAGFGDVGFVGRWTLEICVVQPTRIYPWIDIAQVFFHTTSPWNRRKYDGQYQDQQVIKPSGIWREIQGVINVR